MYELAAETSAEKVTSPQPSVAVNEVWITGFSRTSTMMLVVSVQVASDPGIEMTPCTS